MLQRQHIGTEAVSIWVQRTDAPAPLLAVAPDTPRNPASLIKLLTTFAALDALGPAHQWRTEVAGSGQRQGDTLHGSLYLVGSGDPALTQERLWLLLSRVRALGIRHIRDGIVLDHGALALPPHDPGAFDGRPLRPYNSGPDALLANFNALQIGIQPGNGNEPPSLLPLPALQGVEIRNQLKSRPGPCGLWHRDLEADTEALPAGGLRITVRGEWRNDCGPREWSLAPLPPRAYTRALVARLWQDLGGSSGQPPREGHRPAAATPLLQHESPPLAEVLRDMNKWSNNVMARQVFATLGQISARPGEDAVSAARREIPAQLRQAGISSESLRMDNGAGLSREARSTVRTLAQTLLAAWQRPWMPEFAAGLPLLGVDGTTRKRLSGTPLAGRAHLKTGTLDGVSGIAGYLRGADGRDWVVVMLTNTPEDVNARAAEDALLEWVWEQTARP